MVITQKGRGKELKYPKTLKYLYLPFFFHVPPVGHFTLVAHVLLKP
jgi:hypothetical protein